MRLSNKSFLILLTVGIAFSGSAAAQNSNDVGQQFDEPWTPVDAERPIQSAETVDPRKSILHLDTDKLFSMAEGEVCEFPLVGTWLAG